VSSQAAERKEKDDEARCPAIFKRLGWDPKGLELREGEAFNRWKLIPAATLNHVCLGSIFAWSIFSQPLTRLSGVVAPAANDFALSEISLTFSLVMGGFAWGAIIGKRLDTFGPRVSCLIGASSLTSGFLLAGLGAATQSIPTLYAAGLVWGLSNGWAYVPPVSTVVKFFPDRRGLASGCVILGYGGGAAILTTFLFQPLINRFQMLPEYIGPADSFDFVNQHGSLFVEGPDGLREVVVATASDLNAAGLSNIAEAGAYVVGTGSTGVSEVFAVLGITYGALMAATSFAYRLPNSKSVKQEKKEVHKRNEQALEISVSEAMKTKQFWLMYLGFGASITPIYGLISSGKLIMQETFGSGLPQIVTSDFTSSFVAAMSIANLSGRLIFPTLSDALAKRGGDPFFARKQTYTLMWAMAPLCYSGIIVSVHQCVQNPSAFSLCVFSASFLTTLAVFGGTTAMRPPLVADAFGEKSMAVLTARQLSVVLPAAFLGPQIVANFREHSAEKSIWKLAEGIDDSAFHHAFGADKSSIGDLIQSKTVTIPRLLELLPDSVQDPTPFLYDDAVLVMGAFSAVALASNLMLKPVKRV